MGEATEIDGDLELSWSTIRVRGDQAEPFLQGQLSQDITSAGERGVWSLLLEPDSVVVTTGFVRRSDGGYDVAVPRELAEVALARLRRFLLRTRCTLDVAPSGEGPFATLADQIEASWPGGAEFAPGLTPHAFGRSFVEATVAFDKGCFTGQELVARLDARGASVPWRLVRVAGPDRASLDAYLRSKGPAGPQGVTSSLAREGGVIGLGFAHRSLLSGELASGDLSVVEVR